MTWLRVFSYKLNELFECLQPDDFFFDRSELLSCNAEGVGRMGVRCISQAQQVADGVDTESEFAGATNEQQTLDCRRFVAPLISCVSQTLGQKPDLFVIADSRYLDACFPREFSDADIQD